MTKTKIGIKHAIFGDDKRGYQFRLEMDADEGDGDAMATYGRSHATKSAALSELRDVLRRLSSKDNSEFARVSRLLESQVDREDRAKRKTDAKRQKDHKQYEIGRIADEVEERILKRNRFDGSDPIRPDVLEKMREGAVALRRAAIYAQRIDWLLSGDDGEDTFLERLRRDLERMESP